LVEARDRSIKNVQGRLIAERRITIQGHPGREIEARAGREMFLDMCLVVVNGQVYMLGVSSATRDAKNGPKFFDNLRINQPIQ
jgi:hypothetical protein